MGTMRPASAARAWRYLVVIGATLVGLSLVFGVAADGASTGPSAPQLQLPPGKPKPMPTAQGKRGKGPGKHGGRTRLGKGKKTSGRPGGNSPGGLVPSGGVLQWHGWPAQVIPQVGMLTGAGCTGTVVDVNLVLTAAHCLYDQDSCAEYRSMKFYPGMTWDVVSDPRSVKAAWGVWDVGRFWIPDGYRCQFGKNRWLDWGLVEIRPNGGKQIGNVVGGWWPVYANLSVGSGARLYPAGYPASGKWATAEGYNGRGQYACDAKFDGRWEDIDATSAVVWTYVIPCPMNGGVSGGPWFVYLDDLDKWVVGAVSGWCAGANRCTPTASFLKARYLDDTFVTFWQSVQRQR